MITETGWKREYVDEMPLSDAIELDEYWIEEPSARRLIAMFLEYKPSRKLSDVDRKLLNDFKGTKPKSLKKAPKHLQQAAEMLRKELAAMKKEGKSGGR